jgi:hypothetical protein
LSGIHSISSNYLENTNFGGASNLKIVGSSREFPASINCGTRYNDGISDKSARNQGILLLLRTRNLLVRQRTILICALRGHLAEFDLVAGQGWGTSPIWDVEPPT